MIDIVVLPLGATIPVGRKLRFAASGRLDDLTLVPLDKPIWSSSDRTLVDVDQKGVATAMVPGDVVLHGRDRATGVVGRPRKSARKDHRDFRQPRTAGPRTAGVSVGAAAVLR